MNKVIGIAMAAVLLLAASCSNPAASAQSGTPAFVKGVVTAKGSVWVNGVEYQTSGSSVSVDGASKADADLKVGMTVELRAVFDPATGQWKAQHVDYESELKGLVTAVDTTAKTFTVAGTTVQTDSTTVFEGTTDLASLATLTTPFVEVSGSTDSSGKVLATRIEVKALPDNFKVTAVVSSPVTTTATGGSFQATYKKTLIITVNYTGTLDTAIVKGSRVRITFAAADIDLTAKTVTTTAAQIQLRTTEPRPRSGDHSEVHGVVSGLAAGDPVTFTLDTQKVSVSAAVLGTLVLAEGDRVEVEGTVGADGVLVAAKIHADRAETDLKEATGTVASVDTTASTVTITTKSGDVTFTVNDKTIFHGDKWFGTDPLAKLAVGAPVEVKYYVDTTVTPSVNVAVKIESENGDEAHHGGAPSHN